MDLIGREVFYTDGNKGFQSGKIKGFQLDYCDRPYFKVNDKWINYKRLFPSEKYLKERIEEYSRSVRWEDIHDMGNLFSGHCNFSVSIPFNEWKELFK